MTALLTVLCGAVLGAVASRLMRFVARRFGIVDRPNPIVPQHREPIAYLGGVAAWMGTAATLLLLEALTAGPLPAHWRLGVPATFFLLLGVVDDLKPMSPRRKLLLQAAGAALAAALMEPAWTGHVILDAALTTAWIVVVVNAFNLIDVCDGLTTGLAVITLACVASLGGASTTTTALAAAGACLGFLTLNWPPATMFLGDAGSHFLGFVVAVLVLDLPVDPSGAHVLQRVLLVGVPLFELVFLVIVRQRKGLRFWLGSPDHLALRLQAAGLSRLRTDLVTWTAAAALGLAAMLLPTLPLLHRALLLTAVLGAAMLASQFILRHEVEPS